MLENNDSIPYYKGNMGDFGSGSGSISEREISDVNTIFNKFYSNILRHLFTSFKIEMAEATLAWKLFYLLGFSTTGLSYLTAWHIRLGQINFDTIPTPYKNVMYFFSCVFLAILCWRGYQKGRADQISNDEKQFDLEEKKKFKSQPK